MRRRIEQRTGRLADVGVAATLLLVAVAGTACARRAEVRLRPAGAGAGTYFSDVRGEQYPATFASSFRYAGAEVVVTYPTGNAKWLEADLRARGLKPNFCYQVKLEGKPAGLWSAGADDAANRALGYAGRWWRVEPEPGPASDEEVRSKADNALYVYSGYLFFDFFVTDAAGEARVRVRSDQVFDRVRKRAQREPEADDGAVRTYVIEGTTVELYGERAAGRSAPGKAVLRPGRYDVQISLTEEAFGEAPHARVLASDGVRFGISRW